MDHSSSVRLNHRFIPAIAKALQTKVYCDSRKTAILRCEADPELHDLLTTDPLNAGVHLVPLGVVASDKLKVYLERWKGRFSKIIGFRPTGWTCVALHLDSLHCSVLIPQNILVTANQVGVKPHLPSRRSYPDPKVEGSPTPISVRRRPRLALYRFTAYPTRNIARFLSSPASRCLLIGEG